MFGLVVYPISTVRSHLSDLACPVSSVLVCLVSSVCVCPISSARSCAIGNRFQICSLCRCLQLYVVNKRPLTELCALLAIFSRLPTAIQDSSVTLKESHSMGDRRIFLKISAPHCLITTYRYRINLISAVSISLGSGKEEKVSGAFLYLHFCGGVSLNPFLCTGSGDLREPDEPWPPRVHSGAEQRRGQVSLRSGGQQHRHLG
jgi:hypothetical protein